MPAIATFPDFLDKSHTLARATRRELLESLIAFVSHIEHLGGKTA